MQWQISNNQIGKFERQRHLLIRQPVIFVFSLALKRDQVRFQELAVRFGLKGLNWHSLRHVTASLLDRCGSSPSVSAIDRELTT
jgi:hypothetical protein